jgi:hypothetical protein
LLKINEVQHDGPLNFDLQSRFECVFNDSTPSRDIYLLAEPTYSGINHITAGTPPRPTMAIISIGMLTGELGLRKLSAAVRTHAQAEIL